MGQWARWATACTAAVYAVTASRCPTRADNPQVGHLRQAAQEVASSAESLVRSGPVWSGLVWYGMGDAPGADLWVVSDMRDLSLTSSNAIIKFRGVLDWLDRLTEADQSYVFALPRPVLGEFAVEVCQFDLAEDARGILARAANDRVHSGNVGQAPVRCSASRERFLSYIRRVD